MSNFDALYRRLASTNRGEPLSPDLDALLRRAYDAIIDRPYDARRVADALEAVLEFLASPAGRTQVNCEVVDSFFCLQQDWEGGWEDEPEELADVLEDMGGALHETLKAPQVAEDFDSTPEQLLARVRRFRSYVPAV